MLEPQSDMGSSDLPTYPDQVLDAGKATLGKNQRKSIAKEKQITQRDNISKAVCALLNSGGGIVRVGIIDKDYNYNQDGLPEDIKTILSELISSLLLQDYCDFIPYQSFLFIFVKTWSTQNGLPKLCGLDTGLYVRSGTSTKKSDGVQLLNCARGNVKRARRSSGVPWQPHKIKRWLDKPHLTAGENLGLTESEHVEFKDYATGKLEVRMKEIIKPYFSAFGNSDGGYLIIGVKDNGKITGCGKDLKKPELERCIKTAVGKVKIVHFHDCDSSDGDSNDGFYTLTIKDVRDTDQKDPGYVIFLEVKPVCCLAFADDPQCWILDPDRKEKRLSASKWVEKMTNKSSGLSVRTENCEGEQKNLESAMLPAATEYRKESLESQFERLCIGESPPLAKTVCIKKGLENLPELQDKILGSLENGVTIKPDHLYSELKEEYPELERLLQDAVTNEEGVIILSRSWAVDLKEKSNPNVVCDALLLISGKHPKLCSVVTGKVTETEYEYALGTALTLKKKLVNLGGYTRKLCVIPDVLQLNSENQEPPFPCPDITYPETYKLECSEAVKELLPYLLIVMLNFRSYLSAKIGIEWFNLLTTEQYKVLSRKFFKGPFFVHGPPGTGKTILALEIIKKIKNTFNCSPDNILFICENLPLKKYVKSLVQPHLEYAGQFRSPTHRKDILELERVQRRATKPIIKLEDQSYETRNQNIYCQTATRSSFEIEEFQNVKHIVVDEAQNFQVTKSNWFRKAKTIVEGAGGRGVFYVFLDLFQSCHRKNTGLPDLEKHNVEALTKVVRSPEEIYENMFETMEKIASKRESPLMNEIIEKTRCCHGVSGHYQQEKNLDESTIVKRVADTCKEYLSNGYTPGDIAILCSTDNAVDQYRPLLEKEIKETTKKLRARVNSFVKAENMTKNVIVLDSVRRFSGLERPIVFAIDPLCLDPKIDDNLSLCAASRATANVHLYYKPEGVGRWVDRRGDIRRKKW